jgi:bis(5'-nucleosyl)-tetraphosphatase (symmetrical)
LINRGPQSLETLRFVKNLGSHHRIVLGNHDLHFLAVALNTHEVWKEDTLTEILNAPDRDELVAWLLQQPLIHHDVKLNFTMVHAGLAPQWDLSTALRLAQEVETIIQGDHAKDFFLNMYGNQPDMWDENLSGWDRLRCITNYFTRIRLCDHDGRLELKTKGKLEDAPKNLIPWYQVPNRKNADLNILFGHWAALSGITNTPKVYALDTGCVWGYKLTAMRLEDKKRFEANCEK